MRILINAGPTRENIDPVRFITNRSSGKMGYSLACAAVERGCEVELVSGPVSIEKPEGLFSFTMVESASGMAEVMKRLAPEADLIILCAAVADYRPKKVALSKIKKTEGDLIIELERTEDIALTLGKTKSSSQKLAGFAAETDDLEKNALGKMKSKNFDWIAANAVGLPGRGFASDMNAVTLYGRNGEKYEFALQSKKSLAAEMLDVMIGNLSTK